MPVLPVFVCTHVCTSIAFMKCYFATVLLSPNSNIAITFHISNIASDLTIGLGTSANTSVQYILRQVDPKVKHKFNCRLLLLSS